VKTRAEPTVRAGWRGLRQSHTSECAADCLPALTKIGRDIGGSVRGTVGFGVSELCEGFVADDADQVVRDYDAR
jgi:hypothetical protein